MMNESEVKEYIEKRKDILNRVKKILVRDLNLNLDPEEIDNDAPLFGMGLGLDSIDALDLVVGIESEFGIKIKEEDMFAFRSVNSLVDYIMGISVESSIQKTSIDLWIKDVYDAIRERSCIGFEEYRFRVFELELTERNSEALSRLVAGRTYTVEPFRCLHSVVLNEDGKIEDIVYVMFFEDKCWLLLSKENQKVDEVIERFRMLGGELKEITESMRIVSIEGPYSWKILKEIVGIEILGITYLRMYEWNFLESRVVILRGGTTGEYGYKIFLPKDYFEEFKKKITAFNEVVWVDSLETLKELLSLCSCEFRFPETSWISSGESVVENEMRWMVDWRKEEFIGRERVLAEVRQYDKSVIAFAFVENEKVKDFYEKALEGNVVLGEKVIGKVKLVKYSPKLGGFFGYLCLDKEWAYSGVSGYCLKYGDMMFPIVTLSTPLFFSKSSMIAME